MQNKSVTFWLFLTPVLLSLSLVVIVPLLLGVFYSFTNWDGLTFTQFVGFENYIQIFQNDSFINALWFTTKFTIACVILLNITGLGLALLVTRNLKSKNFLRTVFFMPNLIGGLILGFIWQFIFINVFDFVGRMLGQEWLLGWLSNETTGFWGLVILMVWQMAGYIMIIYIAYLESVPQELVEASEIDGATSFQKLRYVIFPLVRPAFTVSMFLTLSNSFKIYDQNLSLTNGGPYDSTQMLAMDIVRTAFESNQMALGEAKAVIFFLIVAAIALTQVYYNKKREVEV
ncbi:carbohydrate ABC transporter permease [Pallidibacillus pasinlerensis]|uniref:Sugar ABC transporter permease n=1 Tax=Pallidibacillus pasinlerensis TaxID=2703818 RepID=A0ABX0A5U8_9BACI|nr:sugar ABC transporter permease [Pallidibacillus pasinlerensis]NCU18822.1 sugar ABC transporter permease [Pallidibacillus pasinlerensis]